MVWREKFTLRFHRAELPQDQGVTVIWYRKEVPGLLFYARNRGLAGLALAFAVLLACQTEAERKAAENARIEKQAAKEIKRICALPDEQREAELKKIKDGSGMVLYCGSK